MNNDHPSWVMLDGIIFPSVSTAYQAARTDDIFIRQKIAQVQTYQQFKQICLNIQNPPEWNKIKYKVMEKLVRDKFKRSKQLSSNLVATRPRNLVNFYKQGGDVESYWGCVNGVGQNNLGKILIAIREQIYNLQWAKWIEDQNVQNDKQLWPEISLIVIRQEKPIDKLFLQKNNKFLFGSLKNSDFYLQHPSISKQHAAIYIGDDFSVMLVDLNSSHGTKLIRQQKQYKLQAFVPLSLYKDDFIIFGLSSRKYKVQIDLKKVTLQVQKRQTRNN